ncbi:thermonuclease family protein [Rathayibacter rathayi]|uniref:thermonuclease family protein n=1 Tax=Rathayibacter rathayi TaxID=33887 RepID=UPI00132736EF|nr:thermonuclease family protein [Rathayibacter rathayi]MWV75892.1 nuclease [Rathayibacter rathayi NCPPB 2980 = VKM Ac-1601]
MTRRTRATLRHRRGRQLVPGVTVLGILALLGAIAWHGLGADDAGGAAPVPDSLPVGAEHVVVERVVDGDTVHVRTDSNEDLTVRLIGVDTPETVKPASPVQCFGPEASAQTKSLLPAGSSAYLEWDDSQGDTDRYGRAFAYLWYPGPDGTAHNLERELLAGGYAREYTYDRSAYRYQVSFVAEQATARAAGAGLWGACA